MTRGRTTPRLVAMAAALAALLPLSGCGGADAEETPTLTVFAAASLTEPFGELAERFEADHAGVEVRLSFAGSSDLATQIEGGAPADVFASADTEVMAGLGDLAVDPTPFASNTLEIATAPGNPQNLSGFDDLSRPDLKVVVCADPVPCGRATAELEELTGVPLDPVSEEQSVTDVLGKVANGEADAGLVYRSDVTTAEDRVTGVPFPESDEVVNTYPIAVLEDVDHPDLAGEFVDLVRSDEGQQVMRDAGFGAGTAG